LLLALLPTLMIGPLSGKAFLVHAHDHDHFHLHLLAEENSDDGLQKAHDTQHGDPRGEVLLSESEEVFSITLQEVVALRPIVQPITVHAFDVPVFEIFASASMVRSGIARLHACTAMNNGSRDGPLSDKVAAILLSNHALLL